MKKLSDQELTWILNDVFQSVKIDETLSKVNMSRREFNQYLKANPEFEKEYRQAEIDACVFIENDILNIHKKVKDDHKLARVMLEAFKKVLEFRNPARYSPKMDVNVNNQISLRSNLDNANQRIGQFVRDVTPVLPSSTPAKIAKK